MYFFSLFGENLDTYPSKQKSPNYYNMISKNTKNLNEEIIPKKYYYRISKGLAFHTARKFFFRRNCCFKKFHSEDFNEHLLVEKEEEKSLQKLYKRI